MYYFGVGVGFVSFCLFCCCILYLFFELWEYRSAFIFVYLFLEFWEYIRITFFQTTFEDRCRLVGWLVGWLVGYFRLPTLSILVDVIF